MDTRRWVHRLLLPHGHLGLSPDTGFPFLYRVSLAIQAAVCLGDTPPDAWIIDALRQYQGSDGLFSWRSGQASDANASLLGAEILSVAHLADHAIARRLAMALWHVASDDTLFASSSIPTLVNGSGMAALAGIGLLGPHYASFPPREAQARRHALTLVRNALIALPPSGFALSTWHTLNAAARAVALPLAPPRSYLATLAHTQLPNGLFPLNPGQDQGDVQVTERALELLHRYGLHGPYESTLMQTERVYRVASGGWRPIVMVSSDPSDTVDALAILDGLQSKETARPADHVGVLQWLDQLRAMASILPTTLDDRLSWMYNAFHVLAAARYAGVPERDLAPIVAQIARAQWHDTPDLTDRLATGLFWQSAIQDLVGAQPFLAASVANAVIAPFLARDRLRSLPPRRLVAIAALGYLAHPHDRQWAGKVLTALEHHRGANGGYTARLGLPTDLLSTRAAVAIYALFGRSIPRTQALATFVKRCIDPAGGFDAVPPGTKGVSVSTRSLQMTWAGMYVVHVLGQPRAYTARWIQRMWGIGERLTIPASYNR